MTTPTWSAPVNGMPGNLGASSASAHLNQFLGAHGVTPVYTGAGVATPVHGGQNFQWHTPAGNVDIDQPLTMSGTTLGRVVLPLLPAGNGADVLVTLYPDSAGSPNLSSPIAATKVSAAYLNQVAAQEGLPNGGPVATEANNNGFITGSATVVPWTEPASDSGGFSTFASFLVNGNFIISVGGRTQTGSAASLPYVFSTFYAGGGMLSQPVPQPALPQGLELAAPVVCNDTIVTIGGYATAPTAVVYTASWNSGTGVIGAWSQQTSLPTQINKGGAASYGSYVYSVGGLAGAAQTATSAVYMNSVNNGQLGNWTAVNPLPVALSALTCFAVNGWLIVAGGDTASFSAVATTYFAAIHADGTLGTWQTGPNMPAVGDSYVPGFSLCLAGDLLLWIGGGTSEPVQVLAVTANGLGPYWRQSDWVTPAGFTSFVVGAFDNGDGTYDVVAVDPSTPQVSVSKLTPAPMVSVPLPATGLTNGATYHVVVRTVPATSASDYVSIGLIDSSSAGSAYSVSALQGNRWSGTWTTITSGSSVPMQLYDGSASGRLLHLWQDPDPLFSVAQSTGSLLYNNQGLLTALLETTGNPNPPLNANPTFVTTTLPWTATGGTLTRSSAQTHGGFSFSGLLTPAGGTQAFASTELLPVTQSPYGNSQWVMGTGWFYSPTGYSTFSLNINWFDQGQNYLSTTFNTVALTAAAWTQATTYGQVPPTAAYCSLAPTEPGTPTSSNLLYISDAFLVRTPETAGTLSSAGTVNYSPTQPWVPVGTTQLL
ncbi:hypothetical protein [Streptacidiphilus anmyonensis]|uniref:hypothetical protein n=1 Tax=Streptacidiphilus anmyonensis TaxID=405782 RepID=UPI0005A67331|nr:hypothetical protein [Streptacidiphilus anmyonensis]